MHCIGHQAPLSQFIPSGLRPLPRDNYMKNSHESRGGTVGYSIINGELNQLYSIQFSHSCIDIIRFLYISYSVHTFKSMNSFVPYIFHVAMIFYQWFDFPFSDIHPQCKIIRGYEYKPVVVVHLLCYYWKIYTTSFIYVFNIMCLFRPLKRMQSSYKQVMFLYIDIV